MATAPETLCCAPEGGGAASLLNIQGNPTAVSLSVPMLCVHRVNVAIVSNNLSIDGHRHRQMRQLQPSMNCWSSFTTIVPDTVIVANMVRCTTPPC